MFTILRFDEIELLSELSREYSPAVFAVYVALKRHADASGVCFPGYRRIGELSGVKSRTTIARILEALEACGLIARERRGKRTVYRFKIWTLPVQKMDNTCPKIGHDVSKNWTLSISKNYIQRTRSREVYRSSPRVQSGSDLYRPPLVMDP